MISERDIWMAALTLVERHGENAEFHAAKRADELMESSNVEDIAVWKRTLNAAKVLLQDKPEGGRVH